MTSDNSKKYITYGIILLIIILLSLGGGYYIGRNISLKQIGKPEVEYITLPPIHDTVKIEGPSKETAPIDTFGIIKSCIESNLFSEIWPYKTDTVNFTSEDTLQILIDWATRREYSQLLFDIDTLGKCTVNVVCQYNRVDSMMYQFNPIQKSTTVTKIVVRKLEPFVGCGLAIGINANKVATPGVAVQVGAFVKENYGVSLGYQYLFGDLQNHVVVAHFIYKF